MYSNEHLKEVIQTVTDIGEAFQIIHALRAKFGMVGAEFCRDDIEPLWDEMYDSGSVSEAFTDEHWDTCCSLRSWYRSVQDAMIEAGYEVIRDTVIEDIDRDLERGEE